MYYLNQYDYKASIGHYHCMNINLLYRYEPIIKLLSSEWCDEGTHEINEWQMVRFLSIFFVGLLRQFARQAFALTQCVHTAHHATKYAQMHFWKAQVMDFFIHFRKTFLFIYSAPLFDMRIMGWWKTQTQRKQTGCKMQPTKGKILIYFLM